MRHLLVLLGILVGIAIGLPAFAQSAPTPATPTPPASSPKPPVLQHTMGPARIPVRDQAAIDLPGGYAFFPETSGKELMEKMGNRVDDTFVGLIFPQKSSDWFVLVEYQPAGHISDDDAKNWNAEDLLKQVRTSTDAANEERHKQGQAELEVVGWAEKPHYDAATRRLVWSLEARDKGQTDSSRNIVNYKTLMLGREGYVSMTMVSPLATVGNDKEFVNLLLSKLDFTQGRKYVDFNAKTDHIAEYGLAALIAGVAVKKLGLIALIAAFGLKFAKVIAVAVFGGLAAFRRIFRRKPPTAPAFSPAPPPMAGDPTRIEPRP